LNVPDASAVLSARWLAAWSSSVRLTLLASVAPPTSDMTIALVPVGPTRSRSRSSGSVCVMFVSRRLTSVIVAPGPPAYVMLDGYGVAGPSGIRICVAFAQSGGQGGGGGGGVPVSMLSDQPPAISPHSPEASSAT
jgi:hypothetical protein